MKHIIQLLIIWSFFGYESLLSQTANAVSGGEASGTGGTVSYTVGQTAYTAYKSSTGIVTQGCQQPYEIYVITGIKETSAINAELFVYPNPSPDYVKLKVETDEPERLSIRLYNNYGDLILNRAVLEKETVIGLEELPPSSYYLQILDNQMAIKTFIIIKN